jgi:hypothetical protein
MIACGGEVGASRVTSFSNTPSTELPPERCSGIKNAVTRLRNTIGLKSEFMASLV